MFSYALAGPAIASVCVGFCFRCMGLEDIFSTLSGKEFKWRKLLMMVRLLGKDKRSAIEWTYKLFALRAEECLKTLTHRHCFCEIPFNVTVYFSFRIISLLFRGYFFSPDQQQCDREFFLSSDSLDEEKRNLRLFFIIIFSPFASLSSFFVCLAFNLLQTSVFIFFSSCFISILRRITKTVHI